MRNRIVRLGVGILVGFVLLLFNGEYVSAQEMLGVGLGNYSGSMSTLYNPAMLTNTKTFLTIHLATADLFFRNNMYYIPASDYSIYKAIRLQPLPQYGKDRANALMYNNHDVKFAHVSIRTLGPGASFQYGDHGFAVTTGARFFTSAQKIPWEIPVFAYKGMKYDSLHNINFIDYHVNLSSVAWMEAGLSYAYNVYKYFNQQLTIGITVRKLWGYGAVSMATDHADYIVVNDTTINIKNLSSDIGFSLPIDYNQNALNNNPFFKGSGFGLDVGVVYVKKKRGFQRWDKYSLCSQPYEDYEYRIGVSVLDMGGIKFKNHAQFHSFNDVSAYWENYDTINYRNINGIMSSLSNVFYNDPSTSFKASSFTVGLPTTLSVQLDFHTLKNLYIAGFWMHPLHLNKHALYRPAQLAVVPRYETKQLEVSLPLSMYEYRYMRVGLSVRFLFFTVGTERLGTWLGLADLNGMDVYASIHFNLGEKGHCRSRRQSACQNSEYGYSGKQRRLFRKHRR